MQNSRNELLLFKFVFTFLADYNVVWITPGGKLEEGETFEEALIREVYEETGFIISDIPNQIFYRNKLFKMKTGDAVASEERYFLIYTDKLHISKENWTQNEIKHTEAWKWWSLDELMQSSEIFFSEKIIDLMTFVFNGQFSDIPVEIQ
jgi:8-oxo-dGTP pyrophosphatase MutT (NUDIX family)